MPKKTLLLVVLIILCLVGIFWFSSSKKDKVPNFTLQEAIKVEEINEPEKQIDDDNLVASDNTHDQGLNTLEKPTSKVSEKDFTIAKKKVFFALEHLNSSADNTPSFGGFYGITTPQMVELMKAVNANHFLADEGSFQVFESNHENVQQFIFDLTNLEANRTVTATGNINTDTNQVQFATIQGDYGFASYQDSIQSPNDLSKESQE